MLNYSTVADTTPTVTNCNNANQHGGMPAHKYNKNECGQTTITGYLPCSSWLVYGFVSKKCLGWDSIFKMLHIRMIV